MRREGGGDTDGRVGVLYSGEKEGFQLRQAPSSLTAPKKGLPKGLRQVIGGGSVDSWGWTGGHVITFKEMKVPPERRKSSSAVTGGVSRKEERVIFPVTLREKGTTLPKRKGSSGGERREGEVKHRQYRSGNNRLHTREFTKREGIDLNRSVRSIPGSR